MITDEKQLRKPWNLLWKGFPLSNENNKTIFQKVHDFYELDKIDKKYVSPYWIVWSNRFLFVSLYKIQTPHVKGFIYIPVLGMADPA